MKYRIILFFFLLVTMNAGSQITAQWRGKDRDGNFPSENLAAVWPAGGPELLWSAEGIGDGFSSAVSDGVHVFVTGMKDDQDVLTCLSMTGKIRWQTAFGTSWTGPFPETRSTPTVDQERVYAISGSGMIACMDTSSGKIIWSVDGVKTFEGVFGTWGVCESPLINGDHLIYTPGGKKTTMVALDKFSGKTVWMSAPLNDTTAYVSPRVVTNHGREIIITILERYFIGINASTGELIWKFDYAFHKPEKSLMIWPGAPRTNTNTPLYSEDMIYITGGYNHPGVMLKISGEGNSVSLLWEQEVLDCHHGGVVKLGDYIYGSNWIDNNKGNWCCLDWRTGKVMYEHKWFTKGAMISAGNMLYCIEEKTGNVALVKADSVKFELLSSFKIPFGKGPYWAHPFISGTILLVRHGDVVMGYDISAK